MGYFRAGMGSHRQSSACCAGTVSGTTRTSIKTSRQKLMANDLQHCYEISALKSHTSSFFFLTFFCCKHLFSRVTRRLQTPNKQGFDVPQTYSIRAGKMSWKRSCSREEHGSSLDLKAGGDGTQVTSPG